MPKEKLQSSTNPDKSAPTGEIQLKSKGVARAVEYIKEILNKEGDIIKAIKTSDGGWEVEIEVVEPSEYMRKIGILKPVYDRNVYRVILDQHFDLVSYERKMQKPYGSTSE